MNRSLLFNCIVFVLSLSVFGMAGAQTQMSMDQKVGTGGFGFSGGLQRYDLGELNTALRNQGFPTLAENTARLSLFVSRRYPGRLKSTFGFYTENFETPQDRPAGGFGFIPDAQSTRARAGGFSVAIDFDLLYPSAWNVYVGANVDAGALRLVTTRVNMGGFAADINENKFTAGTVGISPQLTVESIEINTKSGGFRVIGSVGYRFGVSQELDRDNFLTQKPGVEISPTGANWQLGFVATIK